MSAGGGSREVKNEINVTPLVDVVLVLLIIFLVTMPVLMRTVTLEVPRKAEDFEDTSVAAKSLIVTYRGGDQVVLNDGDKDQTLPLGNLAAALRPLLDAKKGERVVFVDFCNQVPWAEVVGTMDRVRSLTKGDGALDVKVALKKKSKKAELAEKGDPCQ
jgi:biopolymer transport protein ExbD